MTPFSNTMQLRPSFDHLDAMDASERMNKFIDDDDDEPAPAETQAVKVLFRRKESEEALEARAKSVNALQAKQDEESWIPLSFYAKNVGSS